MTLGEDGVFVLQPREQTEYHMIVRFMMVGRSFLLGLSLTNLFIVMLGLSYSAAAGTAELAFTRSRACLVLDHYAIRLGLKIPFRCIWRACSRVRRACSIGTSRRSPSHSDISDGSMVEYGRQ